MLLTCVTLLGRRKSPMSCMIMPSEAVNWPLCDDSEKSEHSTVHSRLVEVGDSSSHVNWTICATECVSYARNWMDWEGAGRRILA